MTASTVPGLLADLLADDPARPLVTFYDDATGERVELSVKSFENWVAKTANLLVDELSTDPGDHVALWLPTHWQSAVWTCATAACGVVVSNDAVAGAGADVVVCAPDALAGAKQAGARETVALSLHPMGQAFAAGALPEGVVDYAGSVLAQGDTFLAPQPPDGGAPFAVDAPSPLSQMQLLDRARDSAQTHGLRPQGRLMTDANPAVPTGFADGVLAAMVTAGSVVLVRNADPAAVDGRATQEQVTAQWWSGS